MKKICDHFKQVAEIIWKMEAEEATLENIGSMISRLASTYKKTPVEKFVKSHNQWEASYMETQNEFT